jgi:hypothetical protein
MITSVADERIKDVRVTDDELVVALADGRTLSVPLVWYPRLLNASAKQRSDWELIGDGEGIRWPRIDEDLSAAGLLRGVPAPKGHPLSLRPEEDAPKELNYSDISKAYEEGKHRRYNLWFAVNGGAFAVAQFFTTNPEDVRGPEDELVGSLTYGQLSLGMVLFTIVMVLDIYMFGENMRQETIKPNSTNRHELLQLLFSSKLSKLFSWQGKLVLILIGLLISAGWTLVSFKIWWLALVVLGLLGSIALVSLLSERSSDPQTPAT